MSRLFADMFSRPGTKVVPDGRNTSSTTPTRAETPNTPLYAPSVKGVQGVSTTAEPVGDLSDLSGRRIQPVKSPAQAIVDPVVVFHKSFEVVWNGSVQIVQFWSGQRLNGTEIAVDTETDLIADHKVPALAMLSASTGTETYLIQPKDAAAFLMLHATCNIAFHNVAFDFWVLMEHFRISEAGDAVNLLWTLADTNLLHDTMLLDELVRLSTDGTSPYPRDLGVVATEWAGVTDLDKSDPYRLRYGEIVGKDWRQVDAGFFIYAAKDALATAMTYRSLKTKAEALALSTASYMWSDAYERFGVLTEAVQVKGAIAVDRIGATGMFCDRAQLAAKDADLAAKIKQRTKALRDLPETEGLCKYNKKGELQCTKTGVPSMKERALQGILRDVLSTYSNLSLPSVPTTSEGLLSTSEEYWRPYAAHSTFVETWLALIELGKMRQFTQMPDGERIHPTYSVMVLTGRTSCSKPNLQQIPRKGGFRECFVAPPGTFLFVIDYSYIELVTLAAVCLQRYGESRLADVIRQGIDPHCYTAALITGMSLEDFMALKNTEPHRFKDLRQKAKALNFGIPGGLGAVRLQDYARDNYGVELTEKEAEEWRQMVITEVYPELTQYLTDGSMGALAAKLGCSADELWTVLDPQGDCRNWMPIVVRRMLRACKRLT